MTLAEFDQVRPFLPDDVEIALTINLGGRIKTEKPSLERLDFGSHDKRYNLRCPNCGWISDDIYPGQYEPACCPHCSGT